MIRTLFFVSFLFLSLSGISQEQQLLTNLLPSNPAGNPVRIQQSALENNDQPVIQAAVQFQTAVEFDQANSQAQERSRSLTLSIPVRVSSSGSTGSVSTSSSRKRNAMKKAAYKTRRFVARIGGGNNRKGKATLACFKF